MIICAQPSTIVLANMRGSPLFVSEWHLCYRGWSLLNPKVTRHFYHGYPMDIVVGINPFDEAFLVQRSEYSEQKNHFNSRALIIRGGGLKREP